ncbi:MAG: hypothetical protein ACYTAO_03815 [Planctomycetota bacterium]|jgi:hypothetical protein
MEPKKRDSQAFVAVVAFLLFSVLASVVLASEETAIDWERARNLLRKEQRSETLTQETKAYLERAGRRHAPKHVGPRESGRDAS